MTTMALDSGWFDRADATEWRSATGTLFLIGGIWVLRSRESAMLDGPATVIDQQAALRFLTCAGHDIPEQLTAVAETSRLR